MGEGDRSKFFRGEIDRYELGRPWFIILQASSMWHFSGRSLSVQIEINDNRKATWNRYYRAFAPFVESGKVELPMVSDDCEHNAHMFWLKLKNLEKRRCVP